MRALRLPAMRRDGAVALAAGVVLAAGAGPAWAHGPGLPMEPDQLWHHWVFDPLVVLPILLAAGLYTAGLIDLWRTAGVGRGVSRARVACYAGGVVTLLVALVSPLDPLGETLFTAHMVQHAILIAVAPPLLLAGRPAAVVPRALPQTLRRRMARNVGLRGLGGVLAVLLTPFWATLLHAVALWGWHVPAAFDAALADDALHFAEHLSFFATGMFFWQAVVVSARTPVTIPAGAAALFVTMFHGVFLGALITFAPRPVFAWYEGRTAAFGLTPLEDQQLAGIVMGAPLALVYLFAGLALASRLLDPRGPAAPEIRGHEDAGGTPASVP